MTNDIRDPNNNAHERDSNDVDQWKIELSEDDEQAAIEVADEPEEIGPPVKDDSDDDSLMTEESEEQTDVDFSDDPSIEESSEPGESSEEEFTESVEDELTEDGSVEPGSAGQESFVDESDEDVLPEEESDVSVLSEEDTDEDVSSEDADEGVSDGELPEDSAATTRRIVEELEAIGIRQIPDEALEFEAKSLKAPEVELPEDAEDLEALKRTREEAEREKAEKRAKITYKYRQEPSDVATSQASVERQEPYLRTRRIVQVVVLFLIGITITLVALLPEFYLETLYIKGNQLLTDREIMELADLESGKHLLSYVNGDVFQILTGRNSKMEARFRKEHSLIADVRCHVSFPSGFVIDIREHQPMGVLSVPNGFAVVSGDAQVLAFREDLPPIQVPRISGLSLQYLARGERLREEDSRVLGQALRFLDTVVRTDMDADDGFQLFPRIVEVYVDTRQRVDVSFRLPNSERIMLARFGSGDAHSDEIYWLRHVLQTDALNEQGEGYVDLASGEKVFVTPNRPTISETYLETPAVSEEVTVLDEETPLTDIFGQILETDAAWLPTTTSEAPATEATDEWGYPIEESEEPADTEEQTTETGGIETP